MFNKITADSGLKGRCRKHISSSSKSDLITIDSESYIDMLDSLPSILLQNSPLSNTNETSSQGDGSVVELPTEISSFMQVSSNKKEIMKYFESINNSDLNDFKEEIDMKVGLARNEM